MYIILGVLIFVVCVFVIEMCHYAYRTIRNPERGKIQKRLRTLASGKHGNGVSILRRRTLSEIPFLNRILLGIPIVGRLDGLLQQADVRYTLGFFILLTIFLAFIGFLGGSLVTRNYVLSIIIAVPLGAMPFFYVRSRKKRRMKQNLQKN